MSPEQSADSTEYRDESSATRRQVLSATGGVGMASFAGWDNLLDDAVAEVASIAQPEDIEIRYIPHASGATDPFWETQERGWDLAVEQLGVEGSFQGPREEDFVRQVENIEAAIDAGVDGLAVTLPDPPMYEGVLERAAEEDIYVTVTNVTEEEKTMPWNGYIGQPEDIVGVELAEQILPLFEETAGSLPNEAVIANHSPGHAALELRQAGIEDVLDENGVAHDWLDVPEGEPGGVVSSLASHRAANQNVDLVFTLGPVAGEPALNWIQDEGLEGEVYHAGVDISATLAEGIEEGINLGQVIQQPFLQGYLAGHYLALHLQYGVLTPDVTPTGPSFVYAENLESVQMQIDEVGVA